ncbi:hypothetical protein GCM10007242_24840 [Pigmentiphaga litoralis]|nr:hypothetical protein GCM10007242_24840 [Pigmentiphaga litoralis]
MNLAGVSANKANDAVAAANNTMDGKVTARIPNRSINRPATGTNNAVIVNPITKANDVVDRSHPNAFVTGSRNTPKVNCMIGPLPTNSPNTDPTTTHQRFLIFIVFSIGGHATVVVLNGQPLRATSHFRYEKVSATPKLGPRTTRAEAQRIWRYQSTMTSIKERRRPLEGLHL